MLKLHEGQNLLHECPTSELALGESLAADRHAEGVAGSRNQTGEILPDLADPPRRIFDIPLGIADLPAAGELIVLMRKAQPFEPGDIGFKTSFRAGERTCRLRAPQQ